MATDELDDDEREMLRKHREKKKNAPVRVTHVEMSRADAIKAGYITADDDEDGGDEDDKEKPRRKPSSAKLSGGDRFFGKTG